jgi:GH15 family glucan-1,4-alpha-glucosidase
MKIEEVAKKYKSKKHGTIVERVERYLQEHSDEVFRYNDEGLCKAFSDDKAESINFALWRLEKDKKIGKLKISPKVVYFGSKEAIESLRKRLQS